MQRSETPISPNHSHLPEMRLLNLTLSFHNHITIMTRFAALSILLLTVATPSICDTNIDRPHGIPEDPPVLCCTDVEDHYQYIPDPASYGNCTHFNGVHGNEMSQTCFYPGGHYAFMQADADAANCLINIFLDIDDSASGKPPQPGGLVEKAEQEMEKKGKKGRKKKKKQKKGKLHFVWGSFPPVWHRGHAQQAGVSRWPCVDPKSTQPEAVPKVPEEQKSSKGDRPNRYVTCIPTERTPCAQYNSSISFANDWYDRRVEPMPPVGYWNQERRQAVAAGIDALVGRRLYFVDETPPGMRPPSEKRHDRSIKVVLLDQPKARNYVRIKMGVEFTPVGRDHEDPEKWEGSFQGQDGIP